MSSLAGGAGRLFSTCTSFQFPRNHYLLFPRKISSIRRRTQTPTPTILVVASVLRSPPPASELAEDDILQTFLKERELSGDIIAKVSDMLWLGKIIRLGDAEADVTQQSKETTEDENEAGFLKLTRTREWVAGENSAPVNKKMIAKIKREMMLLTMGIGTLCSGYCLVVFSVQAAVSYATGVLFRIGIRSEDLKDQFEKFIQGSGIALSSPRLAIPAAIYGVWGLSQHFASDLFDFQLVPAMFGMFAYKAAALVQVYRDNEDLQLIFPENEDGSSD
ncbi:hypothetical protein Acr_23g0014840 [Actinidia rufa]|uniref:CGL160/ATPI domain-containing protein n=1 Tax=Actinidia rufa TaxID=165716 RepID=A0A7J0GQN4_9ERIC|nr:hypothetical protein Acr_23g0014840 [Actinidia rufa]